MFKYKSINLIKKIYKDLNKMDKESDIENQKFINEFNKIQQKNEKFAQKVKDDMKRYLK